MNAKGHSNFDLLDANSHTTRKYMNNIKFLCTTCKEIVEQSQDEYESQPDIHSEHNKIWAQRPILNDPRVDIKPIVTQPIVEDIRRTTVVESEPNEEYVSIRNGSVAVLDAPAVTKEIEKESAPSLSDDVKQVKDVMGALNGEVLERQDAIRALMLCLISKQHIIMYGLPGTGKNHLIQKFSECVSHSYWDYQISQQTTLDEIFGPWDLVGMKEHGVMRRIIEGTALESEILFLDEIGNSSSPIRNALKWLMNERKFRLGREVRLAPLQMLVSASNSILEYDDATEAAFEDRYLARFVIPPFMMEDESQKSMLMMRNKRSSLPKISHEVISRLQSLAKNVVMTEEFANQAIALRRLIAEDSNAGSLVVSDRRFNQTMELASANAILSGRTKLRRNDLMVCSLTFWKNPEDAQRLLDFLKIQLTTNLAKIEQIGTMVEDAYAAFKQGLTLIQNDVEKFSKATMTQAILKGQLEAIRNIRRASDDDEELEAANAIIRKIGDYVADMARISLELDDSNFEDIETLKKVQRGR